MTAFYSNNKADMEKARRLVTAEIMGRFLELKYHRDDLEKEIDFKVTDRQKTIWMQKERLGDENGIAVWEEDALLPVMQIGEVPVGTCMSYLTGNHKHCLLSCFDSNKKLIFASVQGKVVFRAILRLTKGCYVHKDGENGRQEIEFVDILEEDQRHGQEDDRKRGKAGSVFGTPVLCRVVSEQEDEVMEKVLKLTEQKAKKLGAELAVSVDYKGHLRENEGYVMSSFYLYISKSKNGSQYLDSLGGNATVSDSGSYRRNKFFVKAKEQKEIETKAA
ncbi:MAG: hypothetical protein ACLSFZ_00620 [Frisingicoccus sp.]